MTEQWLLEDINKLIQNRKRIVLLDPTEQCSFVLPILKQNNIIILQTDISIKEHWQQVKEELMLRYDAESKFGDKLVVFYVTRPLEKLTFLYDYAFTHGCLDLSRPQEWLTRKIFANTGLQIHKESPSLITAAKQGIGKDLTWWKKIVQNLEGIINIEEELLPFFNSPEEYLSKKDADVKLLFEEKLFELLGQTYMAKPAKTLAEEVVKKLFDGLLFNEIDPTLLSIYYKWADSATFRPCLEKYIHDYKISTTSNPWNAHPDHCFYKLDLIALNYITENFRDKKLVIEKLHKLNSRILSSKVKLFVPTWWHDILILFDVNAEAVSKCKNLNNFIEYYTGTFSKADRAIRNLYEAFLNEEKIIRPLQEYYESLNHIVLQSWFGFFSEYKPDQQNYLPNLFSKSKHKTAVIVGDGVRFEIADYVATELQKHFNVDKQIMLADMPSETEHNMSALYVGNNEVLAVHKERETRLISATNKKIVFMQLEQLNYGVDAENLVLTYKDIDSSGEKLQQAAIKLFSEFEEVLIEKITLLLNIGYSEVYLITDHGFVLTGLLDEADKIEPNATGKKDVSERFLRTAEVQTNPEWLKFDKKYGEFNYVYAAKNHRPFKSKGVYGFSHGGFTPQEIIIPKFKFTKQKATTSSLSVLITNKTDLAEVPSELFVIKLEAEKTNTDLFAAQRKIQIKLYAGDKEYLNSNIVNIEIGKTVSIECSFNNNGQVQAVLVDAETLEQLDKVIIKKSNLRDLGGL
jgi:hypothetical protein